MSCQHSLTFCLRSSILSCILHWEADIIGDGERRVSCRTKGRLPKDAIPHFYWKEIVAPFRRTSSSFSLRRDIDAKTHCQTKWRERRASMKCEFFNKCREAVSFSRWNFINNYQEMDQLFIKRFLCCVILFSLLKRSYILYQSYMLIFPNKFEESTFPLVSLFYLCSQMYY